MLYATICHGAEFINRFSKEINKVGKIDTVHVLTDQPQYFGDCVTYQYEEVMGRSQFSYYSKLTFLFKLLLEYKERVNYVDADFMRVNFNKLIVENDSAYYSSVIIPKHLTKLDRLKGRKNAYKEYFAFMAEFGLDKPFNYITEAFLSFPYTSKTIEIACRSKELQDYIENIFNSETADWTSTYLSRYAKSGIGFGEGTAVTILAKEYNLNMIGVKSNYDLLINNSLI